MTAHVVAAKDEILPGERKIVQVGKLEIGIFNIGGEYYALYNHCPHQGGPLCQGKIGGTALASPPEQYKWKESGVIKCPWHRWEFDVQTGRCLFDEKVRVKTYPVKLKDDQVVLYL